MVSFFSFCVRNELLRKNAMEALKKPKTPDIVPTDYFRPEEFQAIVKATEKSDFGGGTDCRRRGLRLRTLTLLMRWSGLSILDATKLERDRLSTNENGDDQIFLYRAKTGVPVYVVIPSEVAEALRYAAQYCSLLPDSLRGVAPAQLTPLLATSPTTSLAVSQSTLPAHTTR